MQVLFLYLQVIFFTSIVEYLPPKYGSYTYPTAARALGWLLVAVIMLPIFTQAVYILRKPGQTLLQVCVTKSRDFSLNFIFYKRKKSSHCFITFFPFS